MMRFLLGLVIGIMAGAAAGTVLGGSAGDPRARLRALSSRAKEQTRRSAQAARRAVDAGRPSEPSAEASPSANGTQDPATPRALQPPSLAAVTAPLQSFTEQVRARWREAVA